MTKTATVLTVETFAEEAPSQHRRAGVLAAFVPGALLGAHLGLLLFFLNPRLDLAAITVVRGVLTLGVAVAVVTGIPLAILWRRRPERLLAMLPWGITIAMAIAAASQASHAALFAYYLPPGINLRLLKAASGVSFITLICFYTALLHGMQRRPYGWRSRGGLVLLALLSLLLTAERRAAFPRPPSTPTADLAGGARPVELNLAVVALEGATLDAILPLAEQGQLPFFDTLLRQGAHGRVRTLSPPLRVAVWESVATGAYPFRHGVVSDRTLEAPFLYPSAQLSLAPWGPAFVRWMRPLGVEVRDGPPPARAASLWAILQEAGLPVTVIGWPAELQRAQASARSLHESIFGPPDVTQPASKGLAAVAPDLRPSVGSVDPAVFDPLGVPETVPRFAKEAVVGDLWRHGLARRAIAGDAADRPGAIFLGLPGLLAVSREAFGGYAAVSFDGSSKSEQISAAQLVGGFYRFVDRELARLWSALPEPRLLVVVSGHGVREPRRWRRRMSSLVPSVGIAGRIDGQADGVLLLLGDPVRSGAALDRTTLVDVAPTVLYAMGQPVARDGDGKVQTSVFGSAFLSGHPLTFVPSYTALLGPDG